MGTRWENYRPTRIGSKYYRTLKDSRTISVPKSELLLKNKELWKAGLPAHVAIEVPKKIPTLVAIGGGKGGVGKSILSANIAAFLGQAGFKVLIVDLDLGSANLHTYFGLGMPKKSLTDFILHNKYSFSEILLQTSAPGVALAAGGKDESWLDVSDFGTGVFQNFWDSILRSKQNLGVDIIILDLGAGTHRHTIDFFTSAHMGIITVLPEPTSIENAYSFLKASMWRLIENVGMQSNSCAVADEVKEALFNPKNYARNKCFVNKLIELRNTFPSFIDQIFQALQGRQIGFVVNQIRSQRDIEIGGSMETVSKSYFGFNTRALGYMNYDDAAWKSLRNQRLLVLDFPHCILSKRINEVSKNMLSCLGF